jgi:hypothetical protein
MVAARIYDFCRDRAHDQFLAPPRPGAEFRRAPVARTPTRYAARGAGAAARGATPQRARAAHVSVRRIGPQVQRLLPPGTAGGDARPRLSSPQGVSRAAPGVLQRAWRGAAQLAALTWPFKLPLTRRAARRCRPRGKCRRPCPAHAATSLPPTRQHRSRAWVRSRRDAGSGVLTQSPNPKSAASKPDSAWRGAAVRLRRAARAARPLGLQGHGGEACVWGRCGPRPAQLSGSLAPCC